MVESLVILVAEDNRVVLGQCCILIPSAIAELDAIRIFQS